MSRKSVVHRNLRKYDTFEVSKTKKKKFIETATPHDLTKHLIESQTQKKKIIKSITCLTPTPETLLLVTPFLR